MVAECQVRNGHATVLCCRNERNDNLEGKCKKPANTPLAKAPNNSSCSLILPL